jgi:glycosyltransferase involved in cell wall biosynthesis
MHVVVTGRDMAVWIDAGLRAIQRQTVRELSVVVVVDDASADGSAERARRAFGSDPRFRVVALERRAWATEARQIGLSSLEEPAPHEIVVLLDGDDRLAVDDALEEILRAHRGRRLLVAWGDHVDGAGHPCSWSGEYPAAVRILGSYRRAPWLLSHPRSFRFGLWRRLDPTHLRDADGRWYRVATDRALLLPLLEMAGPRTGFVRRPLYVYNHTNPEGCFVSMKEEQLRCILEIHGRPPVAPLSPEEQRVLLGPETG